MTLLDAPTFDAARDRRNTILLIGSVGLLVVLFVGGWLVSGRPIDWPWHWWMHFRARATANRFLDDVEDNKLQNAYAVWFHDPDWQRHPNNYSAYPFEKFSQDWSPTSFSNEYGAIKTHQIVASRISGNVLLMGIAINGLKSKALFIDYDPKLHTLGFSPVELYLGP
jgi:hypothetical protein